LNFERLTE